MDAKSLNHPQRARQRAIRHDPHHHMHRLRGERNEIPEGIVRGCRLGESPVRLHLYSMDQVRELDGILDEKDRDVIADQIPISFFGVELDRKSADVPRRVYRTCATSNSRYSGEHRSLLPHFGEYPGGGVFLQRRGQFEESMNPRGSRVNDTLGNTLVVEMSDFFAEDEIFEKRRTTRVGLQRVLIV